MASESSAERYARISERRSKVKGLDADIKRLRGQALQLKEGSDEYKAIVRRIAEKMAERKNTDPFRESRRRLKRLAGLSMIPVILWTAIINTDEFKRSSNSTKKTDFSHLPPLERAWAEAEQEATPTSQPFQSASDVVLSRDWNAISDALRSKYVEDVLSDQAAADLGAGRPPTFTKSAASVKRCVDAALVDASANLEMDGLSKRYIWACAAGPDDAELVNFSLITRR